jgi:NAD(P)-dependent dehydrogenase (short-subunit alcohol dehydrogenase family)
MKKRNILITGATGGIGEAIVYKVINKFSRIYIHYNKNITKAEELQHLILSNGGESYLFKTDLSDESEVNDFVKIIKKKVGGIDVLINNAGGVIASKQLPDYTEDDYKKIFNLNFYSAFRLCQEFFPVMCNRQYGRIINISSIGVKFGGGNQTFLYSAAKSSLELLTKNLAKQGAEHNVLVNTVRAGVIDTKFHNNIIEKDMIKRKKMIPVKKIGKPKYIANMVEYLINDRADFITGQTFTVSGGE